jgi:hypothetical protein
MAHSRRCGECAYLVAALADAVLLAPESCRAASQKSGPDHLAEAGEERQGAADHEPARPRRAAEHRDAIGVYQHLTLRLSFAPLRPSRRPNIIFLWPRIVSTSLPRAAAASQNVTTRGCQTRRESRLHAGSHARVAHFTRKGLWASEARDTYYDLTRVAAGADAPRGR